MKSRATLFPAKRILFHLASALLLTVFCSTPALAGSGTFTSGRFNFCVSVRFKATDAELQIIRAGFNKASQVLADATDGQHRFGTVVIVNGTADGVGGASQTAEFWVNKGPGRANANSRFGIRGEHVNLFFGTDFTSDTDNTAYTIAHEMGHHAYGLRDEYSGPGLTDGADCAARPDTASLNFCLMDNFKTRGGRSAATGKTYTLNEFCVAGNHDPDKNTYQEAVHKKSCWATIADPAQRFRANAPLNGMLPVDAPPAAHTVDLRDGCSGCSGLKVVLVLDRSGSLAGSPFEFVKKAADLFIDYLRVGDSIGVVSFSSDATVNFNLTTVNDNNIKTTAKASVDGLTATGSTNIGGGLQAALNQITAQNQRGCNELIVLLTDGDHNTGTTPDAVIPSIQAAGVTVLTVGVGSGISGAGQAALINIASKTGGKYYTASQTSELLSNFFKLVQESTDNALTSQAPQGIASGQTSTIKAPVESGAQTATFGVTTTGSADALRLSLRSPSGALITEADAVSNPNVSLTVGPNARSLQVRAPEPGVWSIIVTAGNLNGGTADVLAFARNDGVQLNASVIKENVSFPEVTVIRATPQFRGESVVGAVVGGVVIRPDGSRDPITLFDDGKFSENGDEQASDGVYTARYGSYTSDGTYTFELTAVNANGTTFAGEPLDTSVPSNAKPVPAFVRMNSATAVVSGVPDLSIKAEAVPRIASPGANITYDLVVTNNGTSAVPSVTVKDVLPAAVKFVSCQSTRSGVCGGTNNDRSVTFSSLPAGATANISVVATTDPSAPDGSVVINTASVSSSTTEPFTGNNSSTAYATLLSSSSNPINSVRFFVRQHYVDFLNREPDTAGFSFWMGGIESCGADAACREVKRIDTSAAFFLSIEFQQTGFLVYRLQKASYGSVPRFSEFFADTQTIGRGVVVGAPGWEQQLENNKSSFVQQWVSRLAFHVVFDGLSNEKYVDTLFANAKVSPTQAERDGLVAGLNAGTETRATVLRKVAENDAFTRQEFNSGFVLMQYFGYLRRNPNDLPDSDFSGFDFWLKKLNDFNGDFRRAEMVKAFLSSIEYQRRF
jgi:uncharacterized repeat protein (TIGR01451 family)